jgi:hypothetical protein
MFRSSILDLELQKRENLINIESHKKSLPFFTADGSTRIMQMVEFEMQEKYGVSEVGGSRSRKAEITQ